MNEEALINHREYLIIRVYQSVINNIKSVYIPGKMFIPYSIPN